MKFKIKDFLFILSLVVIFAQYTKLFSLNYYTQFLIALIWVLYDSLISLVKKTKKSSAEHDIIFFRKIFLTPWLIIALYTFLLYIIHQNENVGLNTYIASNGTILINILFAFSSLRLFKNRALYYSLCALVIVYLLVTLNAILSQGYDIIFTKLSENLITIDSKSNPFEIGDCTFALGLIVIAYLFCKENIKFNKFYIFLCVFFIVLGLKRIQILSMFITFIIGYIFKIISSVHVRKFIMNIFTVIIIFIATFYLHMITERLDEWSGLDMGRFHLYTFMGDYLDFDPSFLGHGYGFSNKFVELNTNFTIIVLHNDIMRMYIELGFYGFYIWLIYYLFLARHKIGKKYGYEQSCLFFMLTTYLMITYFTDNTINYFVTQYLYCLLLPALLMKVSNNKIVCNDYNVLI